MLEISFWLCLAVVAWVFAAYPLVVLTVARAGRRRRGSSAGGSTLEEPPRIAIVLHTAGRRMPNAQNVFAGLVDYPQERLQIFLASSSDPGLTVDLLRALPESSTTFAETLEEPLEAADVVVFCDASRPLRPGALRALSSAFADDRTGAVLGETIRHDEDRRASLTARVRRAEWQLGSLHATQGHPLAVKAELLRADDGLAPKPADLARRLHRRGRTLEVVPEFVCREYPGKGREFEDPGWFWARRWMVVEPVPVPDRWTLPTATAWLHEVLRAGAPFVLVAAMALNLALARQPFYMGVLLAHESVYILLVLATWVKRRHGQPSSPPSVPGTGRALREGDFAANRVS